MKPPKPETGKGFPGVPRPPKVPDQERWQLAATAFAHTYDLPVEQVRAFIDACVRSETHHLELLCESLRLQRDEEARNMEARHKADKSSYRKVVRMVVEGYRSARLALRQAQKLLDDPTNLAEREAYLAALRELDEATLQELTSPPARVRIADLESGEPIELIGDDFQLVRVRPDDE